MVNHTDLNLSNYDGLSNDGLLAIVHKNPHITSLNLSGCNQITGEVLPYLSNFSNSDS